MKKTKPFIGVILTLFAFLILHNAIVIALGNFATIFRKDNREDLFKETYEKKIQALEIAVSEYEKSLQNLDIFSNSANVLAKISLRNIYDFYDYLIISTDKKVSVGDAVINEGGLVGTIKEANKYTAKVALLTGSNKISVRVGDNFGMLSEYDKKNGELVIHNIDNYKTVEEGTKVYTSGLQEIDKNILVGTVKRIDNNGIEKTVYVTPSVDFDNLNYLIVEAK